MRAKVVTVTSLLTYSYWRVAGSGRRLSASLVLVGGKDGTLLRRLKVPDSAESYYSPVIYRQRDGTQVVLFGTGGETHRGSLWSLPLSQLYAGNITQVWSTTARPSYLCYALSTDLRYRSVDALLDGWPFEPQTTDRARLVDGGKNGFAPTNDSDALLPWLSPLRFVLSIA